MRPCHATSLAVEFISYPDIVFVDAVFDIILPKMCVYVSYHSYKSHTFYSLINSPLHDDIEHIFALANADRFLLCQVFTALCDRRLGQFLEITLFSDLRDDNALHKYIPFDVQGSNSLLRQNHSTLHTIVSIVSYTTHHLLSHSKNNLPDAWEQSSHYQWQCLED